MQKSKIILSRDLEVSPPPHIYRIVPEIDKAKLKALYNVGTLRWSNYAGQFRALV